MSGPPLSRRESEAREKRPSEFTGRAWRPRRPATGLTFRVGYIESATRTILGTVPDPEGPKSRVTQNIAMHGRLFEQGKMLALARALESRFDVWQGRPPVD